MNDRELLEFVAAQVGNLTNEMGEIKKDVGAIKKDVDEIKKDVDEIKKDVDGIKKSQRSLEDVVTRMENSHGEKLDALFDGWKQNTEQLKKHDHKLESIDSKLEKQEVEITVIKGNKKNSM